MFQVRRKRRAGVGRAWRHARIPALAVVLLLLCPAPGAAALPAPESWSSSPGDESDADRPVDVVFIVDESGSLSEADVEAERQAVSEMAQKIHDPENLGSRVSVIGFGSYHEDGVTLDPARQICRPKHVHDPGTAQALSECVRDLKRRTKEEGNDTDHAEALKVALEILEGAEDNAMKIVFMLTDGELDVRNNSQYGDSEDERQAEGEAQLDRRLDEALADKVQIWPLGFGAEGQEVSATIDEQRLEEMAARGYQASCETAEVPQPEANVVDSSVDVREVATRAMATATCAVLEDPVEGDLPPAAVLELDVLIQPIATEGTISVIKNDPRIRVDYIDPRGDEVDLTGDEHDGSAFIHSGANGPVETLHLTYPRAGEWTVRFTSYADAEQESVSATVQWKGKIRAVFEHRGPLEPDSETTVYLTLRIRDGDHIADPEVLADLDFALSVSGLGLDGQIPLRDDGQGPDRGAGDGEFAGVIPAPGQEGTLTVVGTVRGPGVAAAVRTVELPIGAGSAPLSAEISPDQRPTEIWARMEGGGTVTVTNNGDAPEEVTLELLTPDGVSATLDPATATAAPDGDTAVDYTYTIDQADPDLRGGTLQLVVRDGDGEVLASAEPLQVGVRAQPGPIERFLWVWVLLLALVTVAVLYVAYRNAEARRRADVRGLVVRLMRDGQPVSQELRAPSRRADEFAFAVRQGEGTSTLVHADATSSGRYVVRREPPHRVRLLDSAGNEESVALGSVSEPLVEGLSLQVRDERATPGRASDPRTGSGGRSRTEEDPFGFGTSSRPGTGTDGGPSSGGGWSVQ